MAAPSLVTINDPRSPAAEAYRTLRANLMNYNALKPVTAFLVTSSANADEKSQAAAEEHFLKSRQELRDLQSRVGLLSDMEREYEGFSKSVKTVMQESGRGKLRGVHGPLGSLVRTGREYTLAIEVALGPALQNAGLSRGYQLYAAVPALLTLTIMIATCSTKRSLAGAPAELSVSLSLIHISEPTRPY